MSYEIKPLVWFDIEAIEEPMDDEEGIKAQTPFGNFTVYRPKKPETGTWTGEFEPANLYRQRGFSTKEQGMDWCTRLWNEHLLRVLEKVNR